MKPPRFSLEIYRGSCIAMHCKTREQAAIFLEFLHSKGREWLDGTPYISLDNYERYGSDTCYYFNKGTFGNIYHARHYHHRILCFDDFDWDTTAEKKRKHVSKVVKPDIEMEIEEEDKASFDDFMKNFRIFT